MLIKTGYPNLLQGYDFLLFEFENVLSLTAMPSTIHMFSSSQRTLLYHFNFFSEVPVSELSLELLLLQVVLPALLEQGHTRQWLKNVMRGWAVAAAFVL